ncbi:MAG: SusD/RagB family nutrient-binding outer membrane lipoprotein [Bacteroidetes bacterium]|nr:MAG: SusD/RagB family nutrient-binding outer membrane lipoprotein [Bacteroidota bacterium]
MKKFALKTIAVMMIATFGFVTSCNFVDPDLNTDPNNPADVTVNLLLPTAEVGIAYILGGDAGRYTTIWTQHHDGVDRQHLAYSVYQLLETDVDAIWGTAYATILQDLKLIREKADANGSPYYSGIAKVLTAITLGTLVDLYNDIPYSQALQGAENLTPAYDTGAQLYETIQSLLTEAKTDFSQSASVLKPGSDDLVFAGNMAKWTALANTLQARYWLHLSEIDATAYTKALAALDAGAISGNAGSADVNFFSTTTNANPWFQFDDQRNDVRMGKFFIDLMNSINDPRITVFATPSSGTTYTGSPAGAPDVAASGFGTLYGSDNSPVPLMLFAEAKFIEAEAAFGTNDKARAAAAHNAAIAASLEYSGVSDAAFLTAQASETDATITLEKILTHKYIALYTTQEPFVDWRRKGIPNLQPADGETRIATRFPYAQSERLYNAPNYKANVTVFDKVFWDK